MAKTGRNQPCACGSGRKTKRCCGTSAGPSPEQQARAWLRAEARWWEDQLAGYDGELQGLADEVFYLPRRDLSLHVPLPRLLPPALERLRAASAARNTDAAFDAAVDALPVIDTPLLRARLARSVLALHDDGHRIECDLTAFAILDLALSEQSLVLLAALLETFAVTTGAARTPSGLVLASR
ncbi:hypothetical protein BH23ACT8_BH23ACT8_01820 [soil metagenome]